MNHLTSNIIRDYRASGSGMNISGGLVGTIHPVDCLKLLTMFDRFSDLLRRPSALPHLVLPLLKGMVMAQRPGWRAA
jgi:hypothetical protein